MKTASEDTIRYALVTVNLGTDDKSHTRNSLPTARHGHSYYKTATMTALHNDGIYAIDDEPNEIVANYDSWP